MHSLVAINACPIRASKQLYNLARIAHFYSLAFKTGYTGIKELQDENKKWLSSCSYNYLKNVARQRNVDINSDVNSEELFEKSNGQVKHYIN